MNKQSFVRSIRAPLALGAMVIAGAAAAQSSAPDASSVVTTITDALATLAAIGAAWLGFKYLKKVWAKL